MTSYINSPVLEKDNKQIAYFLDASTHLTTIYALSVQLTVEDITDFPYSNIPYGFHLSGLYRINRLIYTWHIYVYIYTAYDVYAVSWECIT